MKRQILLYTPVVPSKTIPNSRPNWVKSIPVFRPKQCKNPTEQGGTYLYGFYKRVPPQDKRRLTKIKCDDFTRQLSFTTCLVCRTYIYLFFRSAVCCSIQIAMFCGTPENLILRYNLVPRYTHTQPPSIWQWVRVTDDNDCILTVSSRPYLRYGCD